MAPKYQTAYACEGKNLTIECDPGDLINLIRANYGRFSITICNDHGNVDWSVNCMFPKSLTVLNSRCAHKQSCSVLATTSMFGDPCPGTHKYLEAHYQCISAAQTSTTTNRPSIPWVLTNTPQLLANGSTNGIGNGSNTGGISPALPPVAPPRLPVLPTGGSGAVNAEGVSASGGSIWHGLPSSPGPPTLHTTLPGGRLKGGYNATIGKNNRHDGLPPPPPIHHHHYNTHHTASATTSSLSEGGVHNKTAVKTATPLAANSNTSTPSGTRILTGVGGASTDDGILLTGKNPQNRGNQAASQATQHTVGVGLGTTASTFATHSGNAPGTGTSVSGSNISGIIRTINNINNINAELASDENDVNLYCGHRHARNLFWNVTRVGDVNVQPCPDGATGIAKWRCVLMKRMSESNLDNKSNFDAPLLNQNAKNNACNNTADGKNCEQPTTLANKVNRRIRNFEPTWHPVTPDLTQCRSLWLSNLEVRVNQRDSSLISIANDLSEVTSSKTLYGGDMLVTTKIIQTMSEKMFHDKETFPDQRQREAIILELLHGVVKTGSNLLDESQLSSWLDLNQEDQMRVATSLLTGLEYNAFLLADTMIRERNVIQKVKNILLSVRVLETKNIQANEVFPDSEQWQISDDRIELPRASLIENSEGGLVRIVFAAFDRLESILKPSFDQFDTKTAHSYARNTAVLNSSNESVDVQQQQQEQRVRILNSKVISASLGKGRHIQLSQPIKLVLRHLKTENVSNPTCVFWNYIDHAWSANGCNLEATNRTHSTCTCNHLTNFAILMDVMDEHASSLFSMFDGNMRILIYISISICLVFIVIALLTLKIFNGVFIKSARTSIYRSIYVCLLFVEILFLLGIEQSETSILCGFTTVFLHCSILALIAWFCFEAFQSYSTLTTDDMLLEVDQTSKVNCYYLLSYGLSLTVVAVSLAINPSTYTKNDFCVLMQPNVLFYTTFITPVFIFFLCAVGYALLSWLVMCRKSRTTLKNKEHTRLSNVRFDIRCSFIFLLLLCAVWVSAYNYLRRAKSDDDASIIFGYIFVGFNTLMGLYIFVFHCIQNEKIRREYRKYVRQNSWLPKCLRCSKTSISSGIVGSNGGGNSGTMPGNTTGNVSMGTQLKNAKLPLTTNDIHKNEEAGDIISAAEDAIIGSSDCELTEGQQLKRSTTVGANTIKSGIIPGSLVTQQGKANSIIDTMQSGNHIVLERNTPGASGTLRSIGGGGSGVGVLGPIGMHTPSAGHTSPTSSAGSTHLIFGQGHKQQVQATSGGGIQEAYYHQPDYYHSWRQPHQQQQRSGGMRDYHGDHSPQQQPHEFFYWTQKHNQHGNKKKRSSAVSSSDSPNGSLHSRTTAAAASQQVLFYPSYKKTAPSKLQQQHGGSHHYSEALDAHAGAVYYQQQQQQQQQQSQQHRRQQSAMNPQQYLHQQQQQLSSDDEQSESPANTHLLHLSRRGGPSQLPPLPNAAMYAAPSDFICVGSGAGGSGGSQHYYRNKHSNCDLSHLQQHTQPQHYQHDANYPGGSGGNESYYNQGSVSGSGADGPVYEEILSNRNSDVSHFGIGRGDDNEYDDDDDIAATYDCGSNSMNASSMMGNGFDRGRRIAHATAASATKRQNGKRSHTRSGARSRRKHNASSISAVVHADDDDDSDDCNDIDRIDDDDDDDDDGEDDEANVNHTLALSQSDERMRRLMAMQDEDFQRRFQRQLQMQQLQQQQQQQQLQSHPLNSTVFGIGSGDSVRSYKKSTSAVSPNKRSAVNELFGAARSAVVGPGPPLPPANQHPMQKRQQQQHQQLSPQSITSTSSSISLSHLQQQQQQQQQQPIGRNISAMLDENNTVRCYLEPLTK